MKKLLLLISVLPLLIQCAPEKTAADTVKFVSFPDFFNFDIPEPWPKYDTAVNYFLDEVEKENPDFVLVCGDLVNGHWWDSPKCVEHMGNIYYSGWVRRMQQHNLTFYTAVGDHEMGDDPWPVEKRILIPDLEKVYIDNLKMPQNGPENRKGLAYYVRQENVLMVTVDPFELRNDSMHISVTGEQLEWFDKVLTDNADADFKIIQCHVGIWGDIKSRSSSRLFLDKRRDGEFYNTMKKHGVDAYLAGEFHDVTVLEADGIWQIVHGSSWGRKIVNTQDYLVAETSGNTLHLTMKRIYMDAGGEAMFNINKKRGPLEEVRINPRTLENGPEVTGTLTITNNNGEKIYSNQSGYFSK